MYIVCINYQEYINLICLELTKIDILRKESKQPYFLGKSTHFNSLIKNKKWL